MGVFRSKPHGAILLYEKFTKTQRRFMITDIVSSDGASVICYEAQHEASGSGILKEFYPANFGMITRSADGGLVFDGEDPAEEKKYLRQASEFLHPYALILNAEKKTSRGNIISTFIPYFEIYTGSASDEHPGGIYIWTPQPKLCSFDKVIRKIREVPFQEPERNLHFVLQTLLHLTEQVIELHKAGLVHQDLKPSNFGFMDVDSLDPNPQVMIFDINTVTGMMDSHGMLYGSPGFMDTDPMIQITGRPSLLQDIFSIGAILFNAIVITDETEKNGGLYKAEYYTNLRNMVNCSRLICATENNNYYQLRLSLIRILEKTLAPRESRYRNCEELRDELFRALRFTKTYDLADLLAEIDNREEEVLAEGTVLALQYHLFCRPLYESVHRTGIIHVLIVGFGKFGQQFLDLALQYGQMKDGQLRVTVISKAETDLDAYFLDRPELKQFVRVNGEWRNSRQPFADIVFSTEEIDVSGNNGETVLWVSRLTEKNGSPDYCFVALGDDEQNRAIATELAEAGLNAYYAWSRNETPTRCVDGPGPVYMRKDVCKEPEYSFIDNLAFNIHLSYCDDLLDQDRRYLDFRNDLYDYESSVSCAVSLKYKLHSIGIELGKGTVYQTAQDFNDMICQAPDETINTLAWLEHRRWLVEKVTQGWTAITNPRECLYTGSKNTLHKKHVCLVPSRPEAGLSLLDLKHWDRITSDELEQLDELDQVSVRLHKLYADMAVSYGMDKLQKQSGEMVALIGNEPQTIRLWESLRTCMIRIRRNDDQSIRQYKGLRKQFTDALRKLPRETSEAACKQEELIHVSFFPMLEAKKHTDFKKFDRELVRQIPFQLTYSSAQIVPVLPFGSSNPLACIRNAMTLLALNPARAVLVCRYRPDDNLIPELKCLSDFMTRKKIRTKLELLVGCDFGRVALEQMHDRIVKALPDGSVSVDLFEVKDHGTFVEVVRSCLAYYEGKKIVLASNESFTSKVLWDEEFYDLYPMFWMDFSGRFENTEHCEYLGFIDKTPSLNVEDIISLHFIETEYRAETWETGLFNDTGLWNTYMHAKRMWNDLCDAVCDHEQRNNRLLLLSRSSESMGRHRKRLTCHFSVPKETVEQARDILADLQSHQFIENVEFRMVSSGGADVLITLDTGKYTDARETANRLEYLFVHSGSLRGDYTVKFDPYDTTVEVFRYDPFVDSLQITTVGEERMFRFLGRLEKNGLIRFLGKDDEGRYRFLFLSREAHDLFTDRTAVFRQYTSACLEAGKEMFDDLVRSREMGFTDPMLNSIPFHLAAKGSRAWLLFDMPGCEYTPAVYDQIGLIARHIGPDIGSILMTDAPAGKTNTRAADSARKNEIETVFIFARTDLLQSVTAIVNKG